MLELNDFFESIRGKLDYELDEESLARKNAHSKEYGEYLIDYYKSHPLKGTEAFMVVARSKNEYRVLYSNMWRDTLPKSLFDAIGVKLKKDQWYDAVIVRDFFTNEPIRVESVVDDDYTVDDDEINAIVDNVLKENMNAQ